MCILGGVVDKKEKSADSSKPI
jgi:hypothetical protein